MPTIRLLPDPLVSQIAAGEVVERPASVVKELVENALDAGATAVEIDLENGGKRLVRVTDDGSGMGRDDALLAFDRHATSKIGSFEDLERVDTLGFRGEALASIAAVARVELLTAEEAGEGQRVRIEGGRVRVAEPASRARGTTLEVASLFWNVPARRKFLKSPATELRRSIEVVQGYALARPDVRFTVRHGGRTLMDALPAPEGPEGLRDRVARIFGDGLARELVALPRRTRDDGESLWGLIGNPATTRGRRLFVFVNRRLLKDRAILAVFYKSVREVWKKDDFPALFLFLDVPPEEVDVNVHPQKAEVRFRDHRILDRVAEVLRAGLDLARGEEEAPLRQPEGTPAVPFAWQGLGGRKVDPSSAETGEWRVEPGSSSGPGGDVGYPAGTGGWYRERGAGGGVSEIGEKRAAYGGGGGAPAPGDRLAGARYDPLPPRPMVPHKGRSGEARPFRHLGQYKGTLVLLEGPDGLYLVDQHVAHERILYERLRRSLARETTPSQGLVDPPLLELSAPERMRLLEMAEELEACGFGVAELSGGSVALTAVPPPLSAEEAERLLLEVAADESSSAESVERRILEAMAATLSCKAAVKMHHPLSPEEMEALMAELFAAENPYACPHGRPTTLKMTDADLERRFGRR
jgi:DNA mismatch repair protein MutL